MNRDTVNDCIAGHGWFNDIPGRSSILAYINPALDKTVPVGIPHTRIDCLWIVRINAAARLHGLSYSQFISGLKRNEVSLNRKMLAEIAVRDEEGFKKLADIAKQGMEKAS